MGIEKEIAASMIHIDLKEGAIKTSLYFSPLCDDEDFYQTVVNCWEDEDSGLDGVAIKFDVDMLADDLIDFHSIQNGSIAIGSKPIFDAMRAKLESALSKLNSVTFE